MVSRLRSALSIISKRKKIDDWTCQKYTKKTAVQKTIIENHPEILIVSLKRFTNDGTKLVQRVNLAEEEILDGVTYKLYVVISHHGTSIHEGHYVAYCQDVASKHFYRFSDDEVSRVSDLQFQTEDAYILFFSKAPTVLSLIVIKPLESIEHGQVSNI